MDKQKLNELRSRWITNPQFQDFLDYKLSFQTELDGKPRRTWFATAPQFDHPTIGVAFDLRGVSLENRDLAGCGLESSVLDDGSARGCKFDKILLQGSSADRCDFTGSQFNEAQMSPFYASQAIFRHCIFNSCFLMGIGPRDYTTGAFSDLRNCDFTGVDAIKTYFERCDLRETRFTNGQFTHCNFFQSDLRGGEFYKARFSGCNFTEAEFDDLPSLREMVLRGGNLGVERINWHT